MWGGRLGNMEKFGSCCKIHQRCLSFSLQFTINSIKVLSEVTDIYETNSSTHSGLMLGIEVIRGVKVCGATNILLNQTEIKSLLHLHLLHPYFHSLNANCYFVWLSLFKKKLFLKYFQLIIQLYDKTSSNFFSFQLCISTYQKHLL